MQDNALSSPLFFLNFCSRFYTFNDVAITGGRHQSTLMSCAPKKSISRALMEFLAIVNMQLLCKVLFYLVRGRQYQH